jgi:hypothetical protein
MDHDDVLEQLDLAAVEPGGLERLMAGDTPMAAAVVGHLAGCDVCGEEFRRLSRAVPLLRDVVRTSPPADLRARTLEYVRLHGRARGVAAGTAAGSTAASAADVPVSLPSPAPRSAPARALRWAVAAAAVVAIAVGAFGVAATRADLERQANAVAALEAVNRATIEITGDAEARRVDLAATGGTPTSGTLLFSPSTTRLVVVANELQSPPPGKEYRCWVEVDGRREDVGRMFFAGDLAFWVGDTPQVSDLPDGSAFGVSLTDVASPSLEAEPVILGQL